MSNKKKQFTAHDDYEMVIYAVIYAEDRFDAEEELIKLADERGDLPTGEPLETRFTLQESNLPIIGFSAE